MSLAKDGAKPGLGKKMSRTRESPSVPSRLPFMTIKAMEFQGLALRRYLRRIELRAYARETFYRPTT